MNRMRYGMAVIGGLCALTFAAGCNNGRDMQIDALQGKLRECEGELDRQRADWEARLAAANAERDSARRMAQQLQNELDLARSQPAQPAEPASNLPPDWKESGGFAWTDIADDILFDSGRADLKSSGRSKLQEIVSVIRSQFPDRNVWVVGHTDSEPINKSKDKWIDNLDLSLNRAATVTRELYKMGLDPQHVVAGGQGEYAPKAPNDTRANRAINRRVQIIAVVRPAAMSTGPNASTGGVSVADAD